MLETIRTYNPIGKKSLVLEHTEHQNALLIVGLEVTQKKGELDVSDNFVLDTIHKISDAAKNHHSASLVITDTNVLTKEIQNTEADHEIISEAYPNLNLEDFYYQILKTSTKSFIAVCRKQYVASVIEDYQKENITITDVNLGNLKMGSLSAFFKDAEIISSSATIQISNEEVTAITSIKNEVKDQYQIDDIVIPNSHILPLGVLLDSFADTTKISGNIEEKNLELQEGHKASQFFKKTLQYGLGFLLLSLLINFFVFNSKYKTWQNVQEEQQVYITQKETIKKQQSIVETKEAIVNSILTTGFSKSSYYIDRIIQVLPPSIILKSFKYQPISKTIRKDKAILIEEDMISVTGISAEKAEFTSWLNTIGDLPFVKEVTIINYGVGKKNESGFEVTINIADDTEK